jgi:hypothetical protein
MAEAPKMAVQGSVPRVVSRGYFVRIDTTGELPTIEKICTAVSAIMNPPQPSGMGREAPSTKITVQEEDAVRGNPPISELPLQRRV